MPTTRRKVEGVEGEGLDVAELNAPPSPATKVRARHELLEICRVHCPWNVPAVEALLAKAERELAEASDGKQLRLAVPPNPKRKAEQLAFPFPPKFSPSPAGEGEPGSCGPGARSARAVREPSPRGRRAPQGTRMGAANAWLADHLARYYAAALTRKRARNR